MKENVSVLAAAKFVYYYCLSNDIELSHLKIQKILYYIQAWHLVHFGSPCFSEAPEAWFNGPVYPSVYHHIKKTLTPSKPIKPNLDKMEEYSKKLESAVNEMGLAPNQLDLFTEVLDTYAKLSTNQLILMTHSELPWQNARKGLKAFDYSNKKIDLDYMKSYYSELLNA